MKHLKAFCRVRTGASLQNGARIKSNISLRDFSVLPSLIQRLLLAGVLLLGLALSAPVYANGFVLMGTPVEVREGSHQVFSVKLTQQPAATSDVTVTVTPSSELWVDTQEDVAGVQVTQTFTASNWNVFQQVLVGARQDSDSTDNNASISLTASGGGYDGVVGSVAVTVLDDDLLEIVSTGDVVMIEGRTTSSVSFRLSSQPSDDVTVTLGWLDGDFPDPAIAIDTDPQTPGNQHTATFTPSNWSTARTATLTPINDTNSSNEIGELYIRLPNGAYKTRHFVVIDDDVHISVSPTSLTINEGGTGSFTVRMTSPYENDSTASLALTSDNTAVTFSPNRLNFGQSNWSQPQTVTVSAAQDEDTAHHTTVIRIRDDYELVDESVTVSVTDDDSTIGLTLSSDSLELNEGSSATFTVQLAANPESDQTVTLASNNSDVTLSPSTLSFSASNWSVAQTVTVSAGQDEDSVDDTAQINLTGDGITSAAVQVNVTDDEDPFVGLILSRTSLVLEEGGSATFTVRLAAQPQSDRTVNLAATNSNVTLALTPATLSFSTSNWNLAQTVTIATAQDADSIDSGETIHLTGERITPNSVAVLVLDDEDTAVGLTLSATSLTLNEGSSATFTVQLAAQPGNVRSVVLVSDNPDVTFTPATLFFHSTDWNVAQTVTVSAAQDDDAVDEQATINLAGARITAASVGVSVSDDEDTAVGLTLSATSLTVNEGASATFTVVLAAQPRSDRTVTLASDNTDVTLSPATLDFSVNNWSVAQTVTVSAAQDDDAVDEGATINLTGAKITAASVGVSVTDDEDVAVGLTLSATSLTINEGASATFTVVLAAQPRSSRTVTLASDNTDVTLSPATLDFSVNNWSVAQTVTVSAAQDEDAVDEQATINLAGAKITAASVQVSVSDDEDTAVGLTLSATSLTINEGASTTFTVVLASQPRSSRTVTLASDNTDVTLSPATLDFSVNNWSVAQTVTVSAAQDDDAVDEGATINLTGAKITAASVQVSVTDDEDVAVGLTLSATSLTVNEGASMTFTVVLAAQPRSSRTVTLASDNTDVTLSPATLNFSVNNWSVAQTVTVSAGQDDDAVDEGATINLAGAKITAASVQVSVTDDEDVAVGLTLSATSLTINEGASTTFTVVLASQPRSSRTVTLASDNTDVTLSPATLDFSVNNWSVAQTVTVSAAQDDDAVDEGATINLTGAKITAASVQVNVTDDDDVAVGLTLSATSLTINEGASTTFTVQLAAQPQNALSITPASTNSDVVFNPTRLTFTADNWNVAQTITVRAAVDVDAIDDEAMLHLMGSGIVTASVSVSVKDVDENGLALSEQSLTMLEDDEILFGVKLKTPPIGSSVTVLMTSNNSDVKLNSSAQHTLTFTASNWHTFQYAKVGAENDADSADDQATLSLSASGGNYKNVTGSVPLTVYDDDFIKLSSSGLELTEGHGGAIAVHLAMEPPDKTAVVRASVLQAYPASDLTLDTDSKVSGNQDTLTFTAANWNVPQVVKIDTIRDDDDVNEDVSVGFALTSDTISSQRAVLKVNIVDSNTGPGLHVQQTSIELLERGAHRQINLRLRTQPTAPVTVTITSSDTAVLIDTNISMSGKQNTLVFTPSNWKTLQPVYLEAAGDTDYSHGSATLSLAASGGNYQGVTRSVPVVMLDEDSLVLSHTVLNLVEGTNGSFTVSLDMQPSENVTLTLLPSPASSRGPLSISYDTDAGVAGNQNRLTFMPSNWSVPQTVRVKSLDDTALSQDKAYFLVFLVGDIQQPVNTVDQSVWDRLTRQYRRVSTIPVEVYDNGIGRSVSTTSLVLNEGGSGTFTVELTSAISLDRTMRLTSDNSDVTFSPASLNFTSGNWSTPQTVTVRAAHDEDEADDNATISLSGTALQEVQVTVLVTDDDDSAVGLTLSAASLALNEGASATFTVRLSVQPDSDRTVTLASTNSDVTFSPATLSFSADTWNTPQAVTVSAAQDADGIDDLAEINLTGSGIVTDSLEVSVADDDDPAVGLTLSETSLTINEGASTTFTVVLAAQPRSDRTVTLASDNNDVTLSPATLSFSVNNWSVAQTVTVSAAQDDDAVDEGATINLTGAKITAASMDVRIVDDDGAAGLSLSATVPQKGEISAGRFAVLLDIRPDPGGSIVPAPGGDGEISGDWLAHGAVSQPIEFSSSLSIVGRQFGLGDRLGQPSDHRRCDGSPRRLVRGDIGQGFDRRRRHSVALAANSPDALGGALPGPRT